jgi:hypothetical protein
MHTSRSGGGGGGGEGERHGSTGAAINREKSDIEAFAGNLRPNLFDFYRCKKSRELNCTIWHARDMPYSHTSNLILSRSQSL